MVGRIGSVAVRAACLGLLMLAVACTTLYRNHGYVPADDELAELAVGDSRADVAAAVGRPTSTGILDAGGWYYVQSRFARFAYRAPREIDREVVAISFSADDRVTNIERFGLEDGRVVAISRRVTESNVQGIGFLRQLFGNIGNFNPADFLDGE